MKEMLEAAAILHVSLNLFVAFIISVYTSCVFLASCTRQSSFACAFHSCILDCCMLHWYDMCSRIENRLWGIPAGVDWRAEWKNGTSKLKCRMKGWKTQQEEWSAECKRKTIAEVETAYLFRYGLPESCYAFFLAHSTLLSFDFADWHVLSCCSC